MRNLYLCIAILLLGMGNCFAQDPNNHWQLGVSDLNFTTNPPTVTTIANNGQFGNASISDDNGNLLFYTDGFTIWNKNHQVMQVLNAGQTTGGLVPQKVIIVPQPNTNKYFVFITAETYDMNRGGLHQYMYSIVDFSSNPLGQVVNTSYLGDPSVFFCEICRTFNCDQQCFQ